MLKAVFESLGLFYGLLILLSGFAVLVGAIIIIRKPRSASVLKAYTATIPIPFFIGLFASIQGLMSVFHELANLNISIDGEDTIPLVFTVLSTAFVGFLFALASYIVVVTGMLYWAWRGDRKPDVGT